MMEEEIKRVREVGMLEQIHYIRLENSPAMSHRRPQRGSSIDENPRG